MLAIAELHAPPEVLEALRAGRRSGQWIRARCPFCDPTGRKRPHDLVASHSGFGRNRDRPGWMCHACHAEESLRDARLARMRLRYDPDSTQHQEQRRIEAALKILERCRSIEPDDPVDRYLRRRGLKPAGLTWPNSLKRASLLHPESKKTHPAMVGVVTNTQNEAIAVHRTFLTDDGHKAAVRPTKMSLGPVSGAAIRLGIDSEAIVVAEGIESALAAGLALDLVPWSVLSAGNMTRLKLPRTVKRVVIAPDNDKVGRASAHKLRAAISRAQVQQDRRIRVAIKHPPRGRDDFADLG